MRTNVPVCQTSEELFGIRKETLWGVLIDEAFNRADPWVRPLLEERPAEWKVEIGHAIDDLNEQIASRKKLCEDGVFGEEEFLAWRGAVLRIRSTLEHRLREVKRIVKDLGQDEWDVWVGRVLLCSCGWDPTQSDKRPETTMHRVMVFIEHLSSHFDFSVRHSGSCLGGPESN